MKKLALITAAVLGATPFIAPAAHADDRDDYRHERAGYRDAQTRNWVTLAAMRVQRDRTIDIDRNLGEFRTLRVTAVRGAAYIDFIEVRYGNGEQQHIDVKRRIGRGEVADLDLDGRRHVAAITVHGEPDGRSAIEIVGIR
jgi:hypothetical protein